MKNNVLINLLRTKILPSSIVIISLVFAATISFAISPKSHSSISLKNNQDNSTHMVVAQNIQLPTPTILPTSQSVLAIKTSRISPTPTKSPNISASPANKPLPPVIQPAQTTSTTSVTEQPTLTVTPSSVPTLQPSVAPTQTQKSVSLQINDPEGTTSFSVTLKDGANICDVLEEAKNEGKIASVTIDDSYMASLHSKYVYEINGYKNNWTFTLNGASPLGCSLSNPQPNDTIVWKFG